MNFSSRTIALTVTYDPDLDTLRRQLESLAHQCKTVIIDNGSGQSFREQILGYCEPNPNVQVILLDRNIGISSAQNKGIVYILDKVPATGFVLLLDHDSVPPVGMIGELEKEFDYLAGSGMNPAAIGPLLYDPRDKKNIGFHISKNLVWQKIIPEPDSRPLSCHSLNSSGSLISLDAVRKIGMLENSFFMDHGETEWCFRAIAKGFEIFGSSKVVMTHYMGEDVCEYWFFGKRRMPYRSPKRHYYIVRNSIHLQKLSYVPFTWKFWNAAKILFTYVYFGFISKESGKQRKYIVRGIRDGFRGVTGELQH